MQPDRFGGLFYVQVLPAYAGVIPRHGKGVKALKAEYLPMVIALVTEMVKLVTALLKARKKPNGDDAPKG